MTYEIIEFPGKQINTIISWKWRRPHCYIRLYYHAMHMFLLDRVQPVLYGTILHNGGKHRNSGFNSQNWILYHFPKTNFFFKELIFFILLQLMFESTHAYFGKRYIDWLIDYCLMSTQQYLSYIQDESLININNIIEMREGKGQPVILVFYNGYNAATFILKSIQKCL